MQQIIQQICIVVCGISALVFGLGLSGGILSLMFDWDIEEKAFAIGFIGLIFVFVSGIIGALTAQGANQ